MTGDSLRTRTRYDLACLAKRHAVAGWHGMRKEELIEALRKVLKARKSHKQRNANGHSPAAQRPRRRTSTADSGTHPVNLERICFPRRLSGSSRILKAFGDHANGHDSFVAQSHDAFWIFVRWSISRRSMQRAEAALGFDWHRSVPIIRVYDITSDEENDAAATWVSDVAIHGEVDNWFVPVENPPRSYRLQIGYISPSGKFFMFARSNRVSTPRPSTLSRNGDATAHANGHGSNGNVLQKPPAGKISKSTSHNGLNGHAGMPPNNCRNATCNEAHRFEIHTELVVHGVTHPHATMTLSGETIALDEDGSFSLRLPLPEGRQVIPAVTITPNGAQQRTIVLGIERNTRELEPLDLTKQG